MYAFYDNLSENHLLPISDRMKSWGSCFEFSSSCSEQNLLAFDSYEVRMLYVNIFIIS